MQDIATEHTSKIRSPSCLGRYLERLWVKVPQQNHANLHQPTVPKKKETSQHRRTCRFVKKLGYAQIEWLTIMLPQNGTFFGYINPVFRHTQHVGLASNLENRSFKRLVERPMTLSWPPDPNQEQPPTSFLLPESTCCYSGRGDKPL